jgi:UDP-glucose:(heptosyl)LPS alpha-1,3-glucosyltransferase
MIKSTMPQSKKIAVVVPKYGLLGGAERFVFEMTERLAQQTSHEFHVFANRWMCAEGSPVIFHKIPHLLFPRSLRPLAFAWLVQRGIQTERFDLIHSHERIFHADIVSLHCTPHRFWVRDIRKKRQSLFDRTTSAVERRMIQGGSATTFLPVSSIVRAAFQSEYAQLPGRWQVMHPGVDFAMFSSPDRNQCRMDIRLRHGLTHCNFLALFVGMNFKLKGLDTVMESISIARKLKPQATVGLLVVGRGDEEQYRAKARHLGISDAVAFTGPIAKGIERYYNAADTLMMLSDFDTFGMVVLEAMAAGLPAIIGQNVGALDLVANGINGYVLDGNNNVARAAECLVALCDNEAHAHISSLAQSIAARNDWNALAHAMSDIYARLLTEHSHQ